MGAKQSKPSTAPVNSETGTLEDKVKSKMLVELVEKEMTCVEIQPNCAASVSNNEAAINDPAEESVNDGVVSVDSVAEMEKKKLNLPLRIFSFSKKDKATQVRKDELKDAAEEVEVGWAMRQVILTPPMSPSAELPPPLSTSTPFTSVDDIDKVDEDEINDVHGVLISAQDVFDVSGRAGATTGFEVIHIVRNEVTHKGTECTTSESQGDEVKNNIVDVIAEKSLLNIVEGAAAVDVIAEELVKNVDTASPSVPAATEVTRVAEDKATYKDKETNTSESQADEVMYQKVDVIEEIPNDEITVTENLVLNIVDEVAAVDEIAEVAEESALVVIEVKHEVSAIHTDMVKEQSSSDAQADEVNKKIDAIGETTNNETEKLALKNIDIVPAVDEIAEVADEMVEVEAVNETAEYPVSEVTHLAEDLMGKKQNLSEVLAYKVINKKVDTIDETINSHVSVAEQLVLDIVDEVVAVDEIAEVAEELLEDGGNLAETGVGDTAADKDEEQNTSMSLAEKGLNNRVDIIDDVTIEEIVNYVTQVVAVDDTVVEELGENNGNVAEQLISEVEGIIEEEATNIVDQQGANESSTDGVNDAEKVVKGLIIKVTATEEITNEETTVAEMVVEKNVIEKTTEGDKTKEELVENKRNAVEQSVNIVTNIVEQAASDSVGEQAAGESPIDIVKDAKKEEVINKNVDGDDKNEDTAAFEIAEKSISEVSIEDVKQNMVTEELIEKNSNAVEQVENIQADIVNEQVISESPADSSKYAGKVEKENYKKKNENEVELKVENNFSEVATEDEKMKLVADELMEKNSNPMEQLSTEISAGCEEYAGIIKALNSITVPELAKIVGDVKQYLDLDENRVVTGEDLECYLIDN